MGATTRGVVRIARQRSFVRWMHHHTKSMQLTKAHPASGCLFTDEIKMYRCSLCSYTTRFASYLKRHSYVHIPEKPRTCNLCCSKFKEECAYRLHMKENHGSLDHVCHLCGMVFKYKRVFARHLLCHEESKPISCSVCGYKCKRKQDLIRHTRAMHSAERPRRKTHEEAIASIFVPMHIEFANEFVAKTNTFAARKSAMIDFYIQRPWGFLLFEVDEFQHSGYRVLHEMQRMQALRDFHLQRYPDLYIHIVRYNCHAYKQGGEIKRPTLEDRASKIRECLRFPPQSRPTPAEVPYGTIGYPMVP